MVVVRYKDDVIEHIDISGLQKYTGITGRTIRNIALRLPKMGEYDVVFQRPYESISIEYKGERYNYEISSIKSSNTIELTLQPKIYCDLRQTYEIYYNESSINPIKSVKDLLEMNGFNVDAYVFGIEEDYFKKNNVNMTVVYNSDFMSEIKLYDFLNEILHRVGCVLKFDVINNLVSIHNFLRPCNMFDSVIESEYIEPDSFNESESNIFYNAFEIAFYPKLVAKSVHSYLYEIKFQEGKVYMHESLLTLESGATDFVTDEVVTLKYGRIEKVDGVDVYFPAGGKGYITGNRIKFSAGLKDETILKSGISKSLYKETRIWQDKKISNSKTGVLRHTNADGCFFLGNRIIEASYKKKKQNEFKYYMDNIFETGDGVILEKKKYVVLDKYYDSNFVINVMLEEYR